MEKNAVIGVGIDIGKHKHTAVLRSGEGQVLCPPLHLDDTKESIERLLEQIHQAQQAIGEDAKVTINMEATGVFHIPLFSALSPFGRVILWQPRQAKEATKKNIHRSKTDKRDAGNLALLHNDHKLTPPSTTYDVVTLVGARELVRVFYVLKDTKVNLSRRWTQEAFLVNPALDSLMSPSTLTARRLLDAVPTPDDIISKGEVGIAPLLKSFGRRARVSAKDIVSAAENTLRAPAHEAAATFALRPLRKAVDCLEEQMKEVEGELWAYWEQVRQDTVIQTYPGMGWFRALALHAEFGGLRRFSSGDAAVSFAGLENHVYHSGEKKVDGGMTKAGSPIIRRVLWGLLSSPTVSIPRISAFIELKKGQGKHHSEAIHAASKKVLRTLWAMDHSMTRYRYPISK
jgi:transposase